MRRLIGMLVIAATAVLTAHSGLSQQPSKLPHIGFIGPTSAQLDIFKRALAERGYAEGRDVIIDGRWPESDHLDQLSSLAATLVNLKVNLLVAAGATAARAAKGATTEIPIVFAIVVDPVAIGLVRNMVKPGGNVTGFTNFDPDQARTQLEVLREAIPNLKRVALLGDSGAALETFQTNEEAARSLGVQVQILKVERGAANPDFAGAFDAAKKGGADAVVVLSTPVTTPNRRRIAETAIKYRLPTLSPMEHADAGGLISFGTAFSEGTRRAARYVEMILNGAKPSELPIEIVRQHELVINLRTAREIGFAFPSTMLSRATRVVE